MNEGEIMNQSLFFILFSPDFVFPCRLVVLWRCVQSFLLGIVWLFYTQDQVSLGCSSVVSTHPLQPTLSNTSECQVSFVLICFVLFFAIHHPFCVNSNSNLNTNFIDLNSNRQDHVYVYVQSQIQIIWLGWEGAGSCRRTSPKAYKYFWCIFFLQSSLTSEKKSIIGNVHCLIVNFTICVKTLSQCQQSE